MNEARTVFLDLKAAPGIARVLDGLALLGVVVATAMNSLAGTSCRSTVLTLLLTLVVSLSIHAFFAGRKVYTHFLLCGHLACHPGVGHDLVDGGALGWVKRHHLLEEVLELSRVDVGAALSSSVRLPEEVSTSRRNKTIVRVCWVS